MWFVLGGWRAPRAAQELRGRTPAWWVQTVHVAVTRLRQSVTLGADIVLDMWTMRVPGGLTVLPA